MISPEADYLKDQIKNHVFLFFDSRAKGLFDEELVRFLPYDEAVRIRDKVIAIPYDIQAPPKPGRPYKVKFNHTELTLWNRINPPSADTWKVLPCASTPLWYQNSHGALIPAWNLFDNLFQLLTFGEERVSSRRDAHGRFAAAFSPRLENNLLEIPAFNEAVAAIIAAAAGLRATGRPLFALDDLLKPPIIVLSHDCDILTGNDFWTQFVRAFRVLLPVSKFRPPKIANLWWMIRNAVSPRRFYYDNATGMIDMERCFGYNSTFYFLNGAGGRFGARSKFPVLHELSKRIPSAWDSGIHYNYDTFLNEKRYESQEEQLERISPSMGTAGRAHYLRFDSERSFAFLQKQGIYVDESSGYADRIGYRNGLAGCFQVYDPTLRKTLDIWEIPMTVMDAVLVNQYGDEAIPVFSKLLRHLSCIGGALSVVFHPGQFFNPEYGPMLGVYHKMLIACRDTGAVSKTARSLVNMVR